MGSKLFMKLLPGRELLSETTSVTHTSRWHALRTPLVKGHSIHQFTWANGAAADGVGVSAGVVYALRPHLCSHLPVMRYRKFTATP